MAQTIPTGTAHYKSISAPFTTPAFSFHACVTTTGGQGRKFVTVGNLADANNVFVMGTDVQPAASNKLSILSSNSTNSNQALTTAALDVTGGAYNYIGVSCSSTAVRTAYLNGANKGSSTSTIANPTGVNGMIVSGRITDFTSGLNGQIAHLAVWLRALSDAEFAYLGTGGNPRNIKGLVSYWKFNSGDSPVLDEIANNDLTVVGTVTAGTLDPSFESFMTGTAIAATLNYTQGTAITAIDVGVGAGHLFDSVSSPGTVTLCQLNAPTNPTSTTSAQTAVREIPVGAVTAFTVGNYAKIAGNANPARILAVNVTALTILLDKDQTFASGAAVSNYTVNPLTISGLGVSGGTFNGIPSTSGVQNLCLFRNRCNGNAALVADSNLITINIAASGGGGGGTTLLQVAGSYSGGFSGG